MQFVAAFPATETAIEGQLSGQGVTLVESFAGSDRSFAVFGAADEAAVLARLDMLGIEPARLLPVEFINSPTVGGGQGAGSTPRAGHQVYVIERPIPGVGSLPLEKKQMISMRSNESVEQLGEAIEWDHSYLTSEGTFCVYRAVDEETIRKHAELSGAPIDLITPVTHTKTVETQ
jgi:hypothetical protein